MNLLRIAACYITAALFVGQPANAQFSQPYLAWGLALETDVAADDGLLALHTADVTLDAPLRDWLPQTTPDSFMRLAVLGVRWLPDASDHAVRVKLTLMDMHLQRAFWSGGVTLLDLQTSRLLEQHDVWLEAGTGPGFHADNGSWSVSGHFQAFGGGSRVDTGLPGTSHDVESTWHGGLRSALSGRFRERVFVVLRSGFTTHTGTAPSWWSGRIGVEVRPIPSLGLTLSREQVEPLKGRTAGFDSLRSRTTVSAAYRFR